jgi:hypothetical protein
LESQRATGESREVDGSLANVVTTEGVTHEDLDKVIYSEVGGRNHSER